MEGVPGKFENENSGNEQKCAPDKTGTMTYRHMRADLGTGHIECRHGQARGEKHMPMRTEKHQR